MTNRRKGVFCLLFMSVVLGVRGIYGGLLLLLEPDGDLPGMPPDLLSGLPIARFTLPGAFLLLVIGLVPFFIAIGLFIGRDWHWIYRSRGEACPSSGSLGKCYSGARRSRSRWSISPSECLFLC